MEKDSTKIIVEGSFIEIIYDRENTTHIDMSDSEETIAHLIKSEFLSAQISNNKEDMKKMTRRHWQEEIEEEDE